MIPLEALEEALSQKFTYSTLTAAQKLYDENAIVSFFMDEDEITADVLEGGRIHEVFFEYYEDDEDDEYLYEGYGDEDESLEGFCDCPKTACVHQAVTLIACIEKIQPKNKKLEGFIKPLKISIKKPSSNELKGKHAGEYRHLPLDDGWSIAFNTFKSARFNEYNRWNKTFEGTFISSSELELMSVYTYGNFHGINDKIRIKVEKDGKLYVKCMACKNKSKKLCTHQMELLQKAIPTLVKLNLQNPNFYKNILKDAAKSLKISPQTVDKYFKVSLLETGIVTTGKEDNIVNQEWVELAKNVQEEILEERKNLIESRTQQLEQGSSTLYGFVWANLADYHYQQETKLFPIYFTKGTNYKSKAGMRDANKDINTFPEAFQQPQLKLAQNLFFLSQEKDRVLRFEGIKELIENHLDDLNAIYQYTVDELPFPRAPKISSMNMVTFEPQALDCKISFEVIDGLTHLTRHITQEGQPFDYTKNVYSNDVFCSTKTHAYLFSHYRFKEFMDIFPPNHNTVIFPMMSKLESTKLINQFKSNFEVSASEELILEEVTLQEPQFQILLREAGEFILFEPRLKYGDHSFNAFEEESYLVEEQLQRVAAEDRLYLVDFLKQAHPDFDNEFQVQEYVYLPLMEMLNNYWFLHFNEACEAAGIEVLGQKELSKFKYSKHRAKTHMHIKSGIDWFDVEASVSFGKEQVKMSDWIRALRNKENFVKLKDGSLGILPEEWLEQASKVMAVADVEKGELKISKYRFNVIEDLFENLDDKKILKELKEKKKRLQQVDTNKKYSLPKNVKATLRDYQKYGFEWLMFLKESGFGGILADDMGLGKTLQVITLLADQIDKAPSLVIVPRSLLFNWGAEIDKFCPDLTYVIHHGPGRDKNLEAILPVHIIITTYSTAALDIQMFKDFNFNYIVLDESQAIKNPDSKRYKAMRLLQSNNRLAMTGTPIENNTFDLYAQLSFTSPGLLGSMTSFKNNFSVPIDSQGDIEAAALLRKLIHPFILRRTKEQVAKDLPEKIETIIYCEMDPAQRKLYNNLKKQIKEDLESAVEEKGVNKSKFQMLEGLLRLRQMCNSPLLINKNFTGANANSVKIKTLLESLTEALEQKHNALVFSQFTSLLAIIREELDKRGIRYAYLDGSTTKRQAQVDKFMNNTDIRIFLISIKAGNTGMNLVKADYVYIVDPWWNPAVEAQAIDRTHRIGQQNKVFAYKLICKNTIEEKILKLQAKKKKLASDIIQTDESVLKSLDKEELMALFD